MVEGIDGEKEAAQSNGGDDLLTEPGLCRPEKYCRDTLPRRTAVRCAARRRFVDRICRRYHPANIPTHVYRPSVYTARVPGPESIRLFQP